MLDGLNAALQLDQRALGLRSARQEVLANNIANNDTPDYKARDFDFASALREARADQQLALTRTAPAHLAGSSGSAALPALHYRVPDQPSLDGNTVSMDRERVAFADNALRYQAALSLLNNRLRLLRTAMQPGQ